MDVNVVAVALDQVATLSHRIRWNIDAYKSYNLAADLTLTAGSLIWKCVSSAENTQFPVIQCGY